MPSTDVNKNISNYIGPTEANIYITLTYIGFFTFCCDYSIFNHLTKLSIMTSESIPKKI